MGRFGLRLRLGVAAVAVLAITAAAFAVVGAGTAGVSAEAADGKVVATRNYFATKGPWLVWDKGSCSFKPTTNHPSTYTGMLRKVTGEDLSIVYTAAETTAAADKTINGSFEQYAKLAGINLKIFNNQFPSKSKPIQNAQAAAAVKPAVVVSSIWIPELYPQVAKTYQRACTPYIDMFDINTTKNVPGFQAGFVASGIALADGVIQVVKKRGWPANETWMVVCGAPLIAKTPGTDLDVLTTFRSRVTKALRLSKDKISPILDCKADPNDARTVTTDWLTAHPQAKYVIAVMWNDQMAYGMSQALEDKGYTSATAVAAGGQANQPVLEIMAKGNSILQANFDKDFPTWGIIGLSMAQDIAAGRPVPYYIDPGVVPVVGTDAAKKLLAARKKSAAGG